MRPRSLLALLGPALLVLPGCTSDLPAPTNYVPPEAPRPDNELAVDCGQLPLAAQGARYDQTPAVDIDESIGYAITGLNEELTFVYSVEGDLPADLVIDEATGTLSGDVTADPGTYMFDIVVADVDDETFNARGTCTLQVNEQLSAPLALDTVPFCLQAGESLRELVINNTGDGTEIFCDYPGGNGNGRLPNGITVVPDGDGGCTLAGSIQEDRLGTWVFMMRGTQSGAEVFVPYCVTNNEPQGYDISGFHSGQGGAELLPIMRTYDPTAPFSVGGAGDPRYDVTSPGVCGASCFYRYSFLRTNAPLEDFRLDPDGLVQDSMMQSIGFFHELQVGGPPVPPEFVNRPWVLSVGVDYCISGDMNGCMDAAAQGDASFEFGLIMVPE